MSGRSNCKSRNNPRFATNLFGADLKFSAGTDVSRPFGPKRRNLAIVGLQKVIERTGLPAKEYHDVDHELDQHAAAVVKRGVFAAPRVFVGDEMFLCNDHFDFIEEALRKFI